MFCFAGEKYSVTHRKQVMTAFQFPLINNWLTAGGSWPQGRRLTRYQHGGGGWGYNLWSLAVNLIRTSNLLGDIHLSSVETAPSPTPTVYSLDIWPPLTMFYRFYFTFWIDTQDSKKEKIDMVLWLNYIHQFSLLPCFIRIKQMKELSSLMTEQVLCDCWKQWQWRKKSTNMDNNLKSVP